MLFFNIIFIVGAILFPLVTTVTVAYSNVQLMTDTDNLIQTTTDTIIVDRKMIIYKVKRCFFSMTMTKHTFTKKLTKHDLKILLTR